MLARRPVNVFIVPLPTKSITAAYSPAKPASMSAVKMTGLVSDGKKSVGGGPEPLCPGRSIKVICCGAAVDRTDL